MFHRLTHKHKTLYKPGVGQINFCSPRFRNRHIINVAISMDELYATTYVIPNITHPELTEISNSTSESELAWILTEIIERRRNTQSEVIRLNEGYLPWTGEK